jgi:hypothetical protein
MRRQSPTLTEKRLAPRMRTGFFSEVFHRPCRPATDETLDDLDWSRVVGIEVGQSLVQVSPF